MSLLSALVAAYDRLPNAPPFGYAEQDVQFYIEIDDAGKVTAPLSAFGVENNRPVNRKLVIPYFGGRSGSGAPPYFLWDNTAYVFGVSAKENFDAIKRHASFLDLHLKALQEAKHPAIVGLRRFLESWKIEDFQNLGFPDFALDRNVVFRSASTRDFIHLIDEAKAIWARIYEPDQAGDSVCLATGEFGPIARVHPPLKTFENPARIVSFDKDNDAFSSYGHVQAENAPTSVLAAFKYSAVLNRFLVSNSGHRLQIGDTSTVFWAEGQGASLSEGLFVGFFDAVPTKEGLAETAATQAAMVAEKLEAIRQGKPLVHILPDLDGAPFHVLGLAPNAARLSVRFYWDSSFGQLVANYQRFLSDMKLDPPPRDGWPPLWHYLVELAVQGKREKVPPLIAGEWMRAILTGGRYPMPLLATTLMRIRSDGEVNALRTAILKAVLVRNFSMEVPVSLDPANLNKGYILGRLFAVYEEVQRAALGGNVNATIKDKFYGSASATPQKVFRTLDAGSQNHFSKLRKLSAGRAVNLEKLLTSITDLMEPGNDPIPASLSSAEQALFGIGYYHQRSDFFRKREDPAEQDALLDAQA